MKAESDYRHVYFRLNQHIYEWGKGWVVSEDARNKWHEQVAQLLVACGLTVKVPKMSHSCYEGFNINGESLYMHPMDFSGYIHKENISKFETIIRAYESQYWTVRGVDAYELVIETNTIGSIKKIEENKAKYAELEIAKFDYLKKGKMVYAVDKETKEVYGRRSLASSRFIGNTRCLMALYFYTQSLVIQK